MTQLPSFLWPSPGGWNCPRKLQIAGIATLLLYAGFRVLWPSVGSPAATSSALLGLIAVLTYGHGIRASAPLWLLLAALGVQGLSWWLGYQNHPEWIADNPEFDRLAKLFIFIAVAWWLGGSTRNTLWLWSLAMATFIITTLMLGGLDDWIRGLAGQRVDFGIRNAQHSSMMYGTTLLGLIFVAPRMIRASRYRGLLVGLWLVLVVLSATAIMIGQTRAIWLGLGAALPVALVVYLVYQWQCHHRATLRTMGLAGLAIVLLGGLATTVLHEPLTDRLMTENEVIEHLASGQLENVPYTSIGIRINTWRAAGEWIAERPWAGWSSEGRSLAIKHTPWLPDSVRQRFGHLHNFFLEIWVAYGLLGLAVIGALAIWIGYGCWRSWRAGILPGDIALFGITFFIYWIIVNQFESYNSFWTGVYVHNMVVGGLVTHIWRWQRQKATVSKQHDIPDPQAICEH